CFVIRSLLLDVRFSPPITLHAQNPKSFVNLPTLRANAREKCVRRHAERRVRRSSNAAERPIRAQTLVAARASRALSTAFLAAARRRQRSSTSRAAPPSTRSAADRRRATRPIDAGVRGGEPSTSVERAVVDADRRAEQKVGCAGARGGERERRRARRCRQQRQKRLRAAFFSCNGRKATIQFKQ